MWRGNAPYSCFTPVLVVKKGQLYHQRKADGDTV